MTAFCLRLEQYFSYEFLCVRMLMKPVLLFLACLVSASAAAQPHGQRIERGFGLDRPAQSQDDLRLRRERMQEFRQQIRNRQEVEARDESGPPVRRNFERDVTGDERARGLRRLSPEERQRLRQDMRDAYRR
ncbi:MAG: hypothetical protein H6R19_1881 [Proteobacteria bacterium]|nr:hypothetical protein [Pseudomonadota bacterium]